MKKIGALLLAIPFIISVASASITIKNETNGNLYLCKTYQLQSQHPKAVRVAAMGDIKTAVLGNDPKRLRWKQILKGGSGYVELTTDSKCEKPVAKGIFAINTSDSTKTGYISQVTDMSAEANNPASCNVSYSLTHVTLSGQCE